MSEESQFDVKNAISGVLVVDKPVGLTSHEVVQIIRHGTNIRRAESHRYIGPTCIGCLDRLNNLVGCTPE